VLAESHISIHTWPEAGYAALDIFMCGSAEPDNCIPVLREAFAAKRVEVNEILRGQDLSGQDLSGQDLSGQDLSGQDA
jgi:S-adenosylmethionine decarboxylase